MRLVFNSVGKILPKSVRDFGSFLYSNLPPRIRFGDIYTRTNEMLRASQHWDRARLEEYQFAQFKELLVHAYAHVPFYSRLYNRHGVIPDDIRSLSDARLLPTISKQDLVLHLEEMKATNFTSAKFQYHTTGGSTGVPVGLYWEADRTVPLERAFMRRQWLWAGFDMDRDRSVVLRGIPVQGEGIVERPSLRQLRLSTYRMTSENIDEYIRLILEFRPVALQAYPSSAFIFAQHLRERGGVTFPTLRVVLCGSENIYRWQREMISEAFGCKVYSWYGQSEYVSLAGECEHSTDYHIYPEYGLTEILGTEGQPAEPGETGEIVATGFNNYSMPLIRYRTQDLATISRVSTCACGREYDRLSSVDGRLQEMFVAKAGNLISMTAINFHDDVFDEVLQFQFQQDNPGELTLSIVRKSTYTEQSERKILAGLSEKIGGQVDLSIRYVDHIELTSRGKSRFLIQNLALPSFGISP